MYILTAPVYDNATSGTSASTSTTFSHTCSTRANRLLLVWIAFNDNLTPDPNMVVTYAGVSMSQVGSAVFIGGAADKTLWLFQLVAPATGANNVVADWHILGNDFNVISAVSFTNVNQITPLGTPASASGSSTTPSVDVSSNSLEIVVDGVLWNATSVQTQRTNDLIVAIGGGSGTATGTATTTMAWTLTPTADWAIQGVAVKGV